MTLEEAKKILEKEGFKLGGPGKPGVVSEAFAEYEAPKICEAMQIVCSAGFQLAMLAEVFDERKERLKKEYEKNTKAPGSPLSAVEGIKLKRKDNQNTSENLPLRNQPPSLTMPCWMSRQRRLQSLLRRMSAWRESARQRQTSSISFTTG